MFIKYISLISGNFLVLGHITFLITFEEITGEVSNSNTDYDGNEVFSLCLSIVVLFLSITTDSPKRKTIHLSTKSTRFHITT